ncbi:LA_3751/LA_3752 family putative glycosyltransferase [Leptospira idonii]|uniref:LA_3751/LA_3752 family putative glycosyltransferase n=1 Tax=Leptospira idonii TaxID=1193500 RepID=UPI001AF00FD5|nr:dolichyl-phosphate-mannose--protein mannosyltransferase [Leptospira idonii]
MIKVFFLFLASVLSLFFFLKKDFITVYGDSGFMWLQMMDLIHSGYSTFAFDYSGKGFDPEGLFLPFLKPFLGEYNGKFYIDFPPYFPLVISIVRPLTSSNLSVYLLQAFSLSVSLFFLFRIVFLFTKEIRLSVLSSFGLLLGTTMFTYNMAIHEYSIAVCLLYTGIFFLLSAMLENRRLLIWAGIFCGISLFFRLEFIFTVFAWTSLSFLTGRFKFKELCFYFAPGFLLLLVSLFALNQSIHGHPLGFRYLLTMNDPITIENSKLDVVYETLFGKLRGFFYQSPYLLLFFLFGLFHFGKEGKWKDYKSNEFLFFTVSILSMSLILFTAPNHGDHLSPRYLFGVYPSFFLFTALAVKDILKFSGKGKLSALIVFLLCFGFSVKQLWKTVQFVRESDKTVSLISKLILSKPQDTIVFLETGLPKNLQTYFFEKKQYHVTKEEIGQFLTASQVDASRVLLVDIEAKDSCFEEIFCRDEESLPNLNFYVAKRNLK